MSRVRLKKNIDYRSMMRIRYCLVYFLGTMEDLCGLFFLARSKRVVLGMNGAFDSEGAWNNSYKFIIPSNPKHLNALHSPLYSNDSILGRTKHELNICGLTPHSDNINGSQYWPPSICQWVRLLSSGKRSWCHQGLIRPGQNIPQREMPSCLIRSTGPDSGTLKTRSPGRTDCFQVDFCAALSRPYWTLGLCCNFRVGKPIYHDVNSEWTVVKFKHKSICRK